MAEAEIEVDAEGSVEKDAEDLAVAAEEALGDQEETVLTDLIEVHQVAHISQLQDSWEMIKKDLIDKLLREKLKYGFCCPRDICIN